MTHCKLRTICIAEISKPASRMAIRIFPSSPENAERMGEHAEFLLGFLEMQVFYIKHIYAKETKPLILSIS